MSVSIAVTSLTGPGAAFVDLEWPVAKRGYAWVNEHPAFVGSLGSIGLPVGEIRESPEVIVALQNEWPAPSFRDAPSKITHPLRDLGLHRTFAEIDGTRVGVARFCSWYGMLGRDDALLMPETESDEAQPVFTHGLDIRGERREFWYYHASKVRALLELHHACELSQAVQAIARLGRDRPRAETRWLDQPTLLADFGVVVPPWFKTTAVFHRGQELRVCYPYDLRLEMAAALGEPSSRVDIPLALAREFLHLELRQELQEGVGPWVDDERVGVFQRPHDLLGAIYLHLACEVSGYTPRLMRCHCGRWFEQIRDDHLQCSPGCRVTASRRRARQRSQQAGTAE